MQGTNGRGGAEVAPQTVVIVEFAGKITLESSESPIPGAGGDVFATAIQRAAASGKRIECESVTAVTVATRKQAAETWTMATTDADGDELAKRSFSIQETDQQGVGRYVLTITAGGVSRPVGSFAARTDAEAVGASWQGNRVELGSPSRGGLRRSA